jgi:AcrR family transcriptional regulator
LVHVSPRPQKTTDAQVLAATLHALADSWRGDATLARVARDTGVTPAALVQRFGSRDQLLVAAVAAAAGETPGLLASLWQPGRSAVGVLHAYGASVAATCQAERSAGSDGGGESTDPLRVHLAQLPLDLSDPRLLPLVRAQARALRAFLAQIVADGMAAGEFTATTDPQLLARLVEAVVAGSVAAARIHGAQSLAAQVRVDLDVTLRPYLSR